MKFGGGGAYDEYDPKDHDNHHHRFSGAIAKITLLFTVIGLTCLLMNQSDYSTQLVQRSYSLSSSSTHTTSFVSWFRGYKFEGLTSNVNDHEKKLESILKSASMKDHKTVILTTVNAAWTDPNSVFDLFLESFRIGNQTQSLLKHLVVVALDRKAYSRCLDVHPHCFALTADDGVDFSGVASYMSGAYLKMMWRRIYFLQSVLEMGFNFVFSDVDIMWLRDPFQRFYPDGDFQIACDLSTKSNEFPNGGYTYVKSNNRTIQFYKFWYAAKDHFPGKHDQDVFKAIKSNKFIDDIGLRIRFLDTAYFGGFCEPSKDLDLVVTMHANCCVGLKTKIDELKRVIEDWKRYMASAVDSEEGLSRVNVSWSGPKRCGLKINN